MKRLIIIFSLVTNCFVINAQNLFKVGLKHFNKGEYSLADSLFTLYLNSFPNDKNAHFNHGVSKLYLGDTCSFCDEMLLLCNSYYDKASCELYFKLCGSSDTLFYDNQYSICKKEEYRFTEIKEYHRYYDYETVFVHDKKKKNATIQSNPDDFNKPFISDIIAIYKLYNDSSKVFLYSLTRPTFPGGDDARSDFRKNNPFIQQAKKELGLNKFIADIEYIVDKEGNIKNVILTGTKYKIENVEILMKYINLFISSMPKLIPAKFRDENVEYLVRDFISFW